MVYQDLQLKQYQPSNKIQGHDQIMRSKTKVARKHIRWKIINQKQHVQENDNQINVTTRILCQ